MPSLLFYKLYFLSNLYMSYNLFLLDFRKVYCAVVKCNSALMFLFTNEMVLVIALDILLM